MISEEDWQSARVVLRNCLHGGPEPPELFQNAWFQGAQLFLMDGRTPLYTLSESSSPQEVSTAIQQTVKEFDDLLNDCT